MNALAVLQELGVDHDVVLYMKTPPDEVALRHLAAGLEDPVQDLVRKDSRFQKLGLVETDYVDNLEAVVALLARDKALLQRPVLVRGDRAIVGRPKTRVAPFLS